MSAWLRNVKKRRGLCLPLPKEARSESERARSVVREVAFTVQSSIPPRLRRDRLPSERGEYEAAGGGQS